MTPEDVDAALAANKKIASAQKALDKARADLRAQEAVRDGEVARVAEIEDELERVTRVGDSKADVLGLHKELEAARRAIEDAARVLGPLGGAVRVHEEAVRRATREACREIGGAMREKARAAEGKAAQALDHFDAALDETKALFAVQECLANHWRRAGGEKHDPALDLLSFERHEIQRMRAPHGALENIRFELKRAMGRDRQQPAGPEAERQATVAGAAVRAFKN